MWIRKWGCEHEFFEIMDIESHLYTCQYYKFIWKKVDSMPVNLAFQYKLLFFCSLELSNFNGTLLFTFLLYSIDTYEILVDTVDELVPVYMDRWDKSKGSKCPKKQSPT